MFTEGQQVRVIDDDCPLHGKTVTIIQRNPKCTAEWEVRTENGKEWLVHSCRLRELEKPAVNPNVITVQMMKSEAWAILRAEHSEVSDKSPMEWVKNRIFRLMVEAGMAEPLD